MSIPTGSGVPDKRDLTVLLEQAWAARDHDPATAERLLADIGSCDLDETTEARVSVVRAFLVAREWRLPEALRLALLADDVLEHLPLETWHPRLSTLLGSICADLLNTEAIDYYIRAADEAGRLDDIDQLFAAHLDLGLLYINAGDHAGGAESLDQAEKFVGDDPARTGFLAMTRARSLLKQEKAQEALDILVEVKAVKADGRPAETLALFVAALRADAAARVGLGDEVEAALAVADSLADRHGRETVYRHLARSRLHFLRGEHQRSIEVLDEYRTQNPNCVDEAEAISQLRIQIALANNDFETAFRESTNARESERQYRVLAQVSLSELRLVHESDRLRRQADAFATSNAKLAESMAELQELHKQVLDLSARDSLTKLFNRRQLFIEAGLLMRLARRHGRPFSIAMVDVDHFKAVNDQHYHSTGDAVLRELADILTSEARESDLVGRYGGDEFVILLPEVSLDGAKVLCERIRSAVEKNNWERVKPGLAVTVTIGIAEASAREHADDLLHRADQRLYVAKRLGRNQVAS